MKGIQEFKGNLESMWSKYFPSGVVDVSTGTLGTETVFIKLYSQNKSQWSGGYSYNDPLSLMISINGNTIEYPRRSFLHEPDSKYMAYGSTKLSLRKGKFKDEKDLLKKIETAMKKAHTSMKDSQDKLSHKVDLA